MKASRSLILTCALAACHVAAKPATAPEPAAATNGMSCMAAGRHDDLRRWRMVEAGAFALCAPPDGQLSGSSWHRGTASVEWGVGDPPQRVASAMVAVRAIA